jgi:hypothetical protein
VTELKFADLAVSDAKFWQDAILICKMKKKLATEHTEDYESLLWKIFSVNSVFSVANLFRDKIILRYERYSTDFR